MLNFWSIIASCLVDEKKLFVTTGLELQQVCTYVHKTILNLQVPHLSMSH